MRCSGVGGARYGFMFFSEIAEIFFCCGGGKGLKRSHQLIFSVLLITIDLVERRDIFIASAAYIAVVRVEVL